MAVVANADPIDVALDRIATLLEEPRPRESVDVMLAAASIAALWTIVAEHALDRGDSELLLIASREREHARAAFRAHDPP